jgi:DNA excision repair protein ERCC-2
VRFFPYAPRPAQRELVELLSRAVRAEAHVVVEAPTGAGKTVCALVAAMQGAQATGGRVLYLTRTNSQQHHVLKEFRRVRERAGAPWVGVALQGRRHLCLQMEAEPALAEADAEEFGRMCRDRRQAAERSVLGLPRAADTPCGPCPFYEKALRRGTLDLEAWARDVVPTAEELAARSAVEGVCPDHVARQLLRDATLVVASYPYVLHPALRLGLQRGLGASLEDCIVVVDEAHNFPDAARELWSRELRVETCERALVEAEQFGDPSCQGVLASQFARALRRTASELVEEYLVEEDGPVPEGEVETRLLSQMGCASPRLAQAVKGFQEHGARIREVRRREGKLPRSALGACADFLSLWTGAEEAGWAKLVEGGPARLACRLLDASHAARPLLDARATLHLSGTLAPLEAYRDAVGLPPNTPLHRQGELRAPGQRLALLARDVTTRHEDLVAQPELLPRLARRVTELLALDRPTLVCFPSHELLDRLLPALPRGLAAERPGMGQAELMALVQAFRARETRAIAAVMGGRLAEGLDFPADELEMVVIVGLPYPKPTFRLKALIAHFDARHGRGWEYAVEGPAMRRVVQAAGRLLRGPEDRGVVVVLDRRGQRLLPLMPDLVPTDAPAADAARFWASAAPAGRLAS